MCCVRNHVSERQATELKKIEMINKARWRNIDGTIDASILPCDYRCLSTYI